MSYPLRRFTAPLETFFYKALNELDEAKKMEFRELQHKYRFTSMMASRFPYKNMINGQLALDDIEWIVANNVKRFPEDISINCLMNYFDYLKQICKEGIAGFDKLFGQPLRKS